jgi:hypothetical protein
LAFSSAIVQKLVASQSNTILTVEIGGIKQVIEIKTDDEAKPVLLLKEKIKNKK